MSWFACAVRWIFAKRKIAESLPGRYTNVLADVGGPIPILAYYSHGDKRWKCAMSGKVLKHVKSWSEVDD